ncbi:Nesprin-1, partial [Stegodyphus mimosarum]
MFQKNMKHLQSWLRDAEAILSTPIKCKPLETENYTEKLKELQIEWEEYDNLFKKLSKQMHSVVTHMSAPEVEKVMSSMKKEKELLLRVKTSLMTRLQILYQLGAPLDAFEKGLSGISKWLDEAEKIIASYGIPSSLQEINCLQEKHKTFFSQSPQYRTELENQKAICNNIIENARGIPNLDVSEVQLSMANTEARLESCLSLATQWENAMAEAADRWQQYFASIQTVKEKLQSAETLFNKKPSDEKQLRVHKDFFSNLNDSVIRDMLASSDAVLATLPATEQGPVKETVKGLQEKWKV